MSLRTFLERLKWCLGWFLNKCFVKSVAKYLHPISLKYNFHGVFFEQKDSLWINLASNLLINNAFILNCVQSNKVGSAFALVTVVFLAALNQMEIAMPPTKPHYLAALSASGPVFSDRTIVYSVRAFACVILMLCGAAVTQAEEVSAQNLPPESALAGLPPGPPCCWVARWPNRERNCVRCEGATLSHWRCLHAESGESARAATL